MKLKLTFKVKCDKNRTYFIIAKKTEIIIASNNSNINATSKTIAFTCVGLPSSIPKAFATATVCGYLSKTVNTKMREKKFKTLHLN